MLRKPTIQEGNMLRGINEDYMSIKATHDPNGIDMLVKRIRTGFKYLSDNAKQLLDKEILEYVEGYDARPVEETFYDQIYPQSNAIADSAALAPKIK